jgi:myo-inositol 2-dehydrogenase/D-chiro-inositol 1-dehydrogenase
MSAAKVRIGVIGCGVIAYWKHLRLLKNMPEAQLMAAADPDASARERAKRLTGVDVYSDAGELLARSDIDAVVICTPTNLHAELGIAAARARKHFYIEKPVATNSSDADCLLEAVREAGVAVAVGFNRRCHPNLRQARDLIAKGELGAIRAVLSTFCVPLTPATMPPWKVSRSTGGGVALDLVSHHADLVPWILQDRVVEIDARIQSRSTEDDEAWTAMRMQSGIEARSFFSLHGHCDIMEFIGERGTLRMDRFRPSLSLRLPRRFGYGVRSAFIPANREVLAWRALRLVQPSYDPSYGNALSDFVRNLPNAPAHTAGLEAGLRSLRIVLAAEESSRTGRPLTVS